MRRFPSFVAKEEDSEPVSSQHRWHAPSSVDRGLAKIARELPSYQTSIRLIYGENDRVLPDIAKTMARLKRDHPDAELTALPNCGHFLQEDEPERVGQLIGEFLNRA